MRRLLPRLVLARRNLARSRAQTVLAVLAIVIGVVAISSLGLFGVAFKRAQIQDLQEFGSDVQVYPGEDAEDGQITEEMLAEMRATVDRGTVVPVNQRFDRVRHGRTLQPTRVYGLADPARLSRVRRGEVPTPWRERALVGTAVARRMGVGVGDRVEVGGESYYVSGVVEAREGTRGIFRPSRAVVLPPSAFEGEGYGEVLVLTDDIESANAARAALRAEFNDREQRVRIFERGGFRAQLERTFQRINTFLLGIGAVSLVVAGVSISNVMLMSVIERREEIGLLRAVGFGRLDVLRIVLAESALLGLVGAVVGCLLSLGVGAAVQTVLLSDPWAFTAEGLRYVAVGFGFAVAVSLLGGLSPAWKAARQRPVDALRS